MTDWIRALNPMSPLETEAEAVTAARLSSIALFLGAATTILSIIYMMTAGRDAMAAALEQATAGSPGAENAVGMVAMMTIGFSVFWVLVYLVVGAVQWVKPNIVIPIIFLILTVLSLLGGLVGILLAGTAPAAAATPAWQIWSGLVVGVLQLFMHIAGTRGGSKLRDLRAQRAYSGT